MDLSRIIIRIVHTRDGTQYFCAKSSIFQQRLTPLKNKVRIVQGRILR